MSKSSCYLSILIFLLFVSSLSGQDTQSAEDLNNLFQNYKINSNVVLSREANEQKISIETYNQRFELLLTENDLRSASYYAEETSTHGVRRLDNFPVSTFKGKVSGKTNSNVRLTIYGRKVEGFFDVDGERYFIEPAQKYSRFAGIGDLVVYREIDMKNERDFECHYGLNSKIERGREMIRENAVSSSQVLRVIEIATDADFEYVSALGGVSQANAEIMSILNMAQGVYEAELRLTIRVVYQNFWTTQDPFSGFSPATLLSSFQGFWNTNRTNIQRDTAHLFSGKSYTLSSGFALISVVCWKPTQSYGLSGYVDWAPAKFLITAHEIGHNLGANHVEEGQGCGNSLMNSQLSFSTPLSFCPLSRTEINNYVDLRGSCLTPAFKSPFDFDGDSKTDISIFRPSSGEWWYLRSSNGGNSAVQFGNAADTIVPGDYTGDGKTDIAIFRPADGNWFVLRSEDNSFFSFPFGTSGDIPISADFDGDGRADAGVFRPTNRIWFINKSSGGTIIEQFGISGDLPTVADYDGDGRADIAIYRPSLGQWWISRSSGGLTALQFGNQNDKPVQGDYTGDGKADIALFRPSTGEWFVLRSENTTFYSAPFGNNGDIPALGDYDGDGKFDFAVFRPANQIWFANRSTSGILIQQFGIAGDKPVPSAFLP